MSKKEEVSKNNLEEEEEEIEPSDTEEEEEDSDIDFVEEDEDDEIPDLKEEKLPDEDEEEEEEEEEDDEDNANEDEYEYGEELLPSKKKQTKNTTKTQNKEIEEDFSENDYETEDDSDEEEDDNNLQKFNEHLNMKYLEDIHTEIKSIHYDEMIALSRIVRDKTGRIVDPLHTTLPFLTKYEKARIIGVRAEQIERGGEPFIPVEESIINGRTIAIMEFEAKKLPFILARPLSNGSIEYWKLEDLEVLDP